MVRFCAGFWWRTVAFRRALCAAGELFRFSCARFFFSEKQRFRLEILAARLCVHVVVGRRHIRQHATRLQDGMGDENIYNSQPAELTAREYVMCSWHAQPLKKRKKKNGVAACAPPRPDFDWSSYEASCRSLRMRCPLYHSNRPFSRSPAAGGRAVFQKRSNWRAAARLRLCAREPLACFRFARPPPAHVQHVVVLAFLAFTLASFRNPSM